MNSVERVVANRKKNVNKQIANEVVSGKLGAGEDKRKAVNKAGYDYDAVRDRVNIMLRKRMNITITDIAEEVMEGTWGEGDICRRLLEDAGYDYNDVLREIKRLNK